MSETPDELRALAETVTTWHLCESIGPDDFHERTAHLIDALLARLTAAEADADRLAHHLDIEGALADQELRISSDPPSEWWEAIGLHDEALALRERPQ